MTLQQMRYVIEIAERGSMNEAAKSLFMSQPSLSASIKELEDERENYLKVNNAVEVENLNRQLEIAKSYLPKQLGRDEIKNIILSLDDKSIPNVMKHFKTNFNGQVDMRLVQEVLKEI